MHDSILMVFCAASNEAEAKLIAGTLLQKNLAACCNIIPKINSIYFWQDEIRESNESMIIIKTTQKVYEQLEKEIKMIHSYSVPEIIATKVETGSPAYIDWIMESVERKGM